MVTVREDEKKQLTTVTFFRELVSGLGRGVLVAEPGAGIEDLIEQARRGSHDAFERIVQLYAPRVFQVVARFLRREKVEEVAQEVFLTAYQQLRDYSARGSFEGWLVRIATNRCLNVLRSERRRPELLLGNLQGVEADLLDHLAAPTTAREFAQQEQQRVASDLVERLLASLPPEERIVLQLLDGEDTPVKEIAVLMGWSESKVKVQAFRSRRKLRTMLERLLPEGKVGRR